MHLEKGKALTQEKVSILNVSESFDVRGWVEVTLELLSRQGKESFRNSYVKFRNSTDCVKLYWESISINYGEHPISLFRIANNIAAGFKLARIIDRLKPSICITHRDIVSPIMLLAKIFAKHKFKLFGVLNNSMHCYGWIKGWWLKNIILSSYKRYDHLISVSDEMRCFFIQKHGIEESKISTIYNPICEEDIERLRKEDIAWPKGFKKELKTLIHVARLDIVKKQKYLLEVFNEYQQKYWWVQLLIIGNGPFEKTLKAYSETLESKGHIFFLGEQENVYKYLSSSDLFVYTSWKQEWFWRTLLEALSCGIPIVTHDYSFWAKEIMGRPVGDYGDCVENETFPNGILVPYMDKERYLKALRELLNKKKKKDELINSTRKYQISEILNQWERLIRSHS